MRSRVTNDDRSSPSSPDRHPSSSPRKFELANRLEKRVTMVTLVTIDFGVLDFGFTVRRAGRNQSNTRITDCTDGQEKRDWIFAGSNRSPALYMERKRYGE